MNTTARFERRNTLRRRQLAAALVTFLGIAGVAHAQAITGGLQGTVTPNDQLHVRVVGVGTHLTRTPKPNKAGRYVVTGLVPGQYLVTISRAGKVLATRRVAVSPDATTSVPAFTLAPASEAAPANAQNLGAIHVSASSPVTDVNRIDVSTPLLATTYDMKLVNDLPMGRSQEDIALLNSNVTKDATTTGSIMMGGATPAENRYYFNGFDLTNINVNIGARALPPEAVKSTQVIPDGFGASWSATTGGVISSTVRTGTNKFKAGYSIYFTPATSRLLEPRGHNVVNPTNHQFFRFVSQDRHDGATTQNVWVSGPLIKNKLFFFALGSFSPPTKSRSVSQTSESFTSNRDKTALLNFTWNITNNQSLNVLIDRENKLDSFTNSYSLSSPYNPDSKGELRGVSGKRNNFKTYIANYFLSMSDGLSLQVMGGYFKSGRIFYNGNAAHADEPFVELIDEATQHTTDIGLNPFTNVNQSPSYNTMAQYTAKLSWQTMNNKLNVGVQYYLTKNLAGHGDPPGGIWIYTINNPNALLGNGFRSPASGKYVTKPVFYQTAGERNVDEAAYIEDYWNITPRLVLYGAARFQKVSLGSFSEKYLRTHQISPRIGFSWDVDGDSTFKVGGNIGVYTIAYPLSLAAGIVQTEVDKTSWFTYSGMDPTTKAPTGLVQIGPTLVTANGAAPSPYKRIALGIKPPKEYQANLYMQKLLSAGWSAKIKVSASKLTQLVEQTCDGFDIGSYARAHGFPNYYPSVPSRCGIEFNPGSALTIRDDFAGNGKLQTLTVPNSIFGYPAPRRHYYAITLDLAHQRTASQPYYLNLSYTWGHLYGDDDGLLDLEQRDPGYIGQTGLYNLPEDAVGAFGDLASDIRNSITASGIYYFPDGFFVGGIVRAHTGMPLSCLGTFTLPANNAAITYVLDTGGSHYDVCNGQVAPRGSAGRLPHFFELDMSAGYSHRLNNHNIVSVTLKVQNVLNTQTIINRDQNFDEGFIGANGLPPLSSAYGLPTYQAPRTTQLVFRYQWDQ